MSTMFPSYIKYSSQPLLTPPDINNPQSEEWRRKQRMRALEAFGGRKLFTMGSPAGFSGAPATAQPPKPTPAPAPSITPITSNYMSRTPNTFAMQ